MKTIKRAIVVDDEELSYELIRYLLNKYQLPVNIVGQAASGDEALELIQSLRPDIAFLDIEMPGCNGIQVMERVNTSYVGMIKFIVITAYSSFDYAQAALRLGARDILLKPIEPKQFLETMERVIGYKYTDNKTFNDILEHLNNNYDKPISLNDCARELHITPSYVSRLFKKYTQSSFITYMNELRIRKSMELMRETNLTIKEIAHKVGYNNLNYFHKNFKAISGVTPGTYKSGSK